MVIRVPGGCSDNSTDAMDNTWPDATFAILINIAK